MNRALWVMTSFLFGQASAQSELEPADAAGELAPLEAEVSTDLQEGAALDDSGPAVRLAPEAALAIEAQLAADEALEDEDPQVLLEDEALVEDTDPAAEPASDAELAAQSEPGLSDTDAASDSAEPPGAENGDEGIGGGGEAGEEATLPQLEARLAQLEARMAQLEAQGLAAQAEVSALQEEAASLQEQLSAPGEAADQQRESRQLRVRTLENAMALVVQAYEIVETGEDDVALSLNAATAALEEGLTLAQTAGSPLEAQRFEAAVQAVAQVPARLDQRDFQQAKALMALALAECNQARLLAQASATLPVTAR